jgi:hypothetical protein
LADFFRGFLGQMRGKQNYWFNENNSHSLNIIYHMKNTVQDERTNLKSNNIKKIFISFTCHRRILEVSIEKNIFVQNFTILIIFGGKKEFGQKFF